jgi:hypothetical protein
MSSNSSFFLIHLILNTGPPVYFLPIFTCWTYSLYDVYRTYSTSTRLPYSLLEIWGRIQRKTWFMGPYAGADYNLTLCSLQNRHKHIFHAQPYARVEFNPMPESNLSPCQGLWIWPLFQSSFKRNFIFFSLCLTFPAVLACIWYPKSEKQCT